MTGVVAFDVLPELVVLLYEVCGMVSLASLCGVLVLRLRHGSCGRVY